MDTQIVKQIEEFEAKNDILKVSRADRYKTVDELFSKSQPGSVYYTLLILSIFIVVSGHLLGNAPIVIGGMLVTPVLTPILVIALSISVGEIKAAKAPFILLLKSILITIAIAILLTFIFGIDDFEQQFTSDVKTAILYLIVATSSGIAATLAWVRKEVADILPGIAIAVSLVPPLSLIGIYLGILDFESARFFLLIFLLNLIGILVGSLIVFSLLKFQRSGIDVHRKMEQVEEIKAAKKAKKTAEKVEKKIAEVKKNIEKIDSLAKKEL